MMQSSRELALPVSLIDVEQAAQRIRAVVRRTPLLPNELLSELLGRPVWIKAECLQRTGSFKIRGAYNKIATLTPAERSRGVIAYSSGNHAQGVACAAALLQTSATIVMPEHAMPAKVAGTRRYGADVVYCGTDSEQRRAYAEDLARVRGATLIPPYDDPLIIAGQGTIGLEIVEDLPTVGAVLVPVGGGGLCSGIALAVRSRRPDVRVYGVEPAGAADAAQSLHEGRLVTWNEVHTIADALRAKRMGQLPFAVLSRYVTDIFTVDDAYILDAMALLASSAKMVAEPGGAVAVAALLAGACPDSPPDAPIVVVVSGGNIDMDMLSRAFASGAARGDVREA